MKKLFILVVILFLTSTSVFSATATPSATPTSTSTIDKIKDLVKENLTDTELSVQMEAATKSLMGFTGKVKSIGTKNLTLETDKDLLQVLITDTTTITKAGSAIKTTSIALADSLMVIGQKNKDDVLEAKVINVLPVVDETTLVVVTTKVATIKNINLKTKTFTLILDNQDTAFTLSKKNTVKLEDFEDGDTILAVTKKYQGKYSLSKAVKL